jgi:DGQHR domain-containing protein
MARYRAKTPNSSSTTGWNAMIKLPDDEVQDDTQFLLPPDPDKQEILFDALKVTQPMGDMYLASLPHAKLKRISRFDVRRIIGVEREVESYLGIQRPIDRRRLEQLRSYVNFKDASFPGAVILAIDAEYASFDQIRKEITIRNWKAGDESPSRNIGDIARVIDGQHRIAGLEAFRGDTFDVPVTIFIGADLADQAYVFSTVNLEQTKVTKSLSYDLFALARSRSPQKTAHNIAIALDADPKSAFYKKIKRLGFASSDGDSETITQSTFGEMLMKLYSKQPKVDRDLLLRGHTIKVVPNEELGNLVFRNLFALERDVEIGQIIENYFSAVAENWPNAWTNPMAGGVLGRTNGFRALMRFLPQAYRSQGFVGQVTSVHAFSVLFASLQVPDSFFTTARFAPGTSGEASLLYFFKTGQLRDS